VDEALPADPKAISVEIQLAVANVSLSADAQGARTDKRLVTAAPARASTAGTSAAAFARLVAVATKHRTITARFEGHGCRLAATRTNYRRSLCRSRTIAGTPTPLVVLLCLTASLATFRGRITTFLEERLIRSCEGEVLPAIAARK
jgi:hypothetical protein